MTTAKFLFLLWLRGVGVTAFFPPDWDKLRTMVEAV
jgi:hypothetical protein